MRRPPDPCRDIAAGRGGTLSTIRPWIPGLPSLRSIARDDVRVFPASHRCLHRTNGLRTNRVACDWQRSPDVVIPGNRAQRGQTRDPGPQSRKLAIPAKVNKPRVVFWRIEESSVRKQQLESGAKNNRRPFVHLSGSCRIILRSSSRGNADHDGGLRGGTGVPERRLTWPAERGAVPESPRPSARLDHGAVCRLRLARQPRLSCRRVAFAWRWDGAARRTGGREVARYYKDERAFGRPSSHSINGQTGNGAWRGRCL